MPAQLAASSSAWQAGSTIGWCRRAGLLARAALPCLVHAGCDAVLLGCAVLLSQMSTPYCTPALKQVCCADRVGCWAVRQRRLRV